MTRPDKKKKLSEKILRLMNEAYHVDKLDFETVLKEARVASDHFAIGKAAIAEPELLGYCLNCGKGIPFRNAAGRKTPKHKKYCSSRCGTELTLRAYRKRKRDKEVMLEREQEAELQPSIGGL